MFCVNCGKKISKGRLCDTCLSKYHELFKFKKPVLRIKVCDCGRFFFKGWKEKSELVKTLVKLNMKLSWNAKIRKKEIISKEHGNKIFITVHAEGKVDGVNIKEKKSFQVIKINNKCDICSKISGNYYEAVIQLRDVPLSTLMDIISKDEKKFITKIKHVKNGFDIFFMKKPLAKSKSKQLKLLGLNIKASYKLVGKKKGKELYRDFYSVRRKSDGDKSRKNKNTKRE